MGAILPNDPSVTLLHVLAERKPRTWRPDRISAFTRVFDALWRPDAPEQDAPRRLLACRLPWLAFARRPRDGQAQSGAQGRQPCKMSPRKQPQGRLNGSGPGRFVRTACPR